MLKQIVQKLLKTYLGRYLSNIHSENLSVSVLGGEYKLDAISLNHAYFNQLDTPFKILFSRIGKLRIEAHLTKIASMPVMCTVEDVQLIVTFKRKD